jgi:hypothetical protein
MEETIQIVRDKGGRIVCHYCYTGMFASDSEIEEKEKA